MNRRTSRITGGTWLAGSGNGSIRTTRGISGVPYADARLPQLTVRLFASGRRSGMNTEYMRSVLTCAYFTCAA